MDAQPLAFLSSFSLDMDGLEDTALKDEDSSLCRFCNSVLEDPAHLWSSCMTFDGVRHAIRQECKKDNSIVSFSTPFVWSVTQLIRFFRDPKMAELLSGPGTQQIPL